jgi:hypothetical protein
MPETGVRPGVVPARGWELAIEIAGGIAIVSAPVG